MRRQTKDSKQLLFEMMVKINPDFILNEEQSGVPSEDIKEKLKYTKAVDKAGNPLVLYHGTPNTDFKDFDVNAPKVNRKTEDIGGIYFTSNPNNASNYRRQNRGGRIIKAYLDIRNPLNITDDIRKGRKKGIPFMEAKMKALEKLDKSIHDGVIYEGLGGADEYVVFDNKQIIQLDKDNNPKYRESF